MMESAVPITLLVADCPKSPLPNGAHQYAAVPENIAVKMRGEAPLFFCIWDLVFVTEKTLAEMRATP